MSEIIAIPELRDHIADSGIYDYKFLWCLNKDYHEIWGKMYCPMEIMTYLNDEEYRELCGETRRLEWGVSLFNILHTYAPKNTRYLRLTSPNYSLALLENLPNLKMIDLGGAEFDSHDTYFSHIYRKYEVRNFIENVTLCPNTVMAEKWIEKNKVTNERDVDLFNHYISSHSKFLYACLTFCNLSGMDPYFVLHVYRANIKNMDYLLEKAQYVEFYIEYSDAETLSRNLRDSRIDSVTVHITDNKPNEDHMDYYCQIWNRWDEDDLAYLLCVFEDCKGIDRLEIKFPE